MARNFYSRFYPDEVYQIQQLFYENPNLTVATSSNKPIGFCNRDFWHANPNLYEYNSIIINRQAWEIWEKDRKKSDMCNKKQIKLITVWENDWNYKNNICRRYINIIINKCQKLLI